MKSAMNVLIIQLNACMKSAMNELMIQVNASMKSAINVLICYKGQTKLRPF